MQTIYAVFEAKGEPFAAPMKGQLARALFIDRIDALRYASSLPGSYVAEWGVSNTAFMQHEG